MTIVYHESGTKVDRPIETRGGLVIRPSDFSITRWKAKGEEEDSFWWNREGWDPAARMKAEVAAWDHDRAPYVTALIHENNFYRFGPESWTGCYYADRKKKEPLEPPFDLEARDGSRARSEEEQEGIWRRYQAMVAWAAAHAEVVTSEEIVKPSEGK